MRLEKIDEEWHLIGNADEVATVLALLDPRDDPATARARFTQGLKQAESFQVTDDTAREAQATEWRRLWHGLHSSE